MSPGSTIFPVPSDPTWPPTHTVSPLTVAWEKPRAGASSSGLTFRGGPAGCMKLVCRVRGGAIDADHQIGARRYVHAGEPPSARGVGRVSLPPPRAPVPSA